MKADNLFMWCVHESLKRIIKVKVLEDVVCNGKNFKIVKEVGSPDGIIRIFYVKHDDLYDTKEKALVAFDRQRKEYCEMIGRDITFVEDLVMFMYHELEKNEQLDIDVKHVIKEKTQDILGIRLK